VGTAKKVRQSATWVQTGMLISALCLGLGIAYGLWWETPQFLAANDRQTLWAQLEAYDAQLSKEGGRSAWPKVLPWWTNRPSTQSGAHLHSPTVRTGTGSPVFPPGTSIPDNP